MKDVSSIYKDLQRFFYNYWKCCCIFNGKSCDFNVRIGGDNMVINKEREVEPLREFDKETYKEALKDGNLHEYENEIEMTYEILNVPNEIMELPKQAQSMLYFYCDRQFRNPETGNKTYNDLFESYIASLEDKSIIENVYFS